MPCNMGDARDANAGGTGAPAPIRVNLVNARGIELQGSGKSVDPARRRDERDEMRGGGREELVGIRVHWFLRLQREAAQRNRGGLTNGDACLLAWQGSLVHNCRYGGRAGIAGKRNNKAKPVKRVLVFVREVEAHCRIL